MEEVVCGCAQNADGSLRDASDIQWYNDAADEHPISGASSSNANLFGVLNLLKTIPMSALIWKPVRSDCAGEPSAWIGHPKSTLSVAGIPIGGGIYNGHFISYLPCATGGFAPRLGVVIGTHRHPSVRLWTNHLFFSEKEISDEPVSKLKPETVRPSEESEHPMYLKTHWVFVGSSGKNFTE
ncbi:hypothetical protein B0H19DRAFT_1080237 [Mycena capillaripes]|nr:hypothetical protein B0H19DRAFT_1080237 [Mycena capillaripes]